VTRALKGIPKGAGWNGVLVIDKPPGPTSHDVVHEVRRKLGCKVGHTGTLDPAASGVLPLVLGKATRLSRYLTAGEKEYLAGIKLGLRTDTFDMEGTVVEQLPIPDLSRCELEELLERFRGVITQLPPMFSAVRVGGERLYQAARRGQIVERQERRVLISELQLIEQGRDRWLLRVRCTAGGYIRSLAEDLGRALGCGAVIESLRRTRSGPFSLDDAVLPRDLDQALPRALIPLDRLLLEMPALELEQPLANRVLHGNALPVPSCELTGRVRLLYGGQLLAVGRVEEGVAYPELVLADILRELTAQDAD
jgi:tRNA pseudouridine55 synthase